MISSNVFKIEDKFSSIYDLEIKIEEFDAEQNVTYYKKVAETLNFYTRPVTKL